MSWPLFTSAFVLSSPLPSSPVASFLSLVLLLPLFFLLSAPLLPSSPLLSRLFSPALLLSWSFPLFLSASPCPPLSSLLRSPSLSSSPLACPGFFAPALPCLLVLSSVALCLAPSSCAHHARPHIFLRGVGSPAVTPGCPARLAHSPGARKAGQSKRTTSTFRSSWSQWSVASRSRLAALRSKVATTARSASVKG